MTKQATTRNATLAVLFVSSLGTALFMTGIVLYLLESGLSAATASTAVAITVLPNLFFGHLLGRWVDRSDKVKLFLGLNLYLAAVETAIIGLIGFWRPPFQPLLVSFLLLAFSFGFSPLITIIYSYIIPSLHEDSAYIYAQWEKAGSIATMAAGLLGFAILGRYSAVWLIVFDVASFLLAAIAIPLLLKPQAPRPMSEKAIHTQAGTWQLAAVIARNKMLLCTAIAMWAFALTLSSIENNSLTISWIALQLGPANTALITCVFAASGLAGSQWLSSQSTRIGANLEKTQQGTLAAGSCILLAMALGVSTGTAWIGVACLLALAFLEPTWATANNLLIRRQVDEGQIGEVLGLVRMPRSLLTMVGTSLVGWSQDKGMLSYFLTGGSLILLAAAAWSVFEKRLSYARG